jgi:uncharacterized membrane protein YkoI
MEVKRILAGAGVAAMLVLAAFATGGISQSTTGAQTLKPQASSAPKGVTGTQNISSVAAARAGVQQAAPAQQSTTQSAQTPGPTEAAGTPEPTEVAGQDGDNVQSGDQSGADTGADNSGAETPASEAADAQALASKARISQQQAEQTALSANPGTTVTHSSLGDENGTVVYDVELSNGSDVKVNAQSGALISTDQAGSDGTENGGSEGTSQP